MNIPDDEVIAAKVEELDSLIEHLQKRRLELAGSRGVSKVGPAPLRKEAGEAKASTKSEKPPMSGGRMPQPARPKDALEKTLDELPWKSFKKKEGEWAFLRDREGMLIDELQSAKEFVDRLRKEGEVVVGKYRYQVSEDKFINRHYEGEKAA